MGDAVRQNEDLGGVEYSCSPEIGLLQWGPSDEEDGVEHVDSLPSVEGDVRRGQHHYILQRPQISDSNQKERQE